MKRVDIKLDRHTEESYSDKHDKLERIFKKKKTDRKSIQSVVDIIIKAMPHDEFFHLEYLFDLVQNKSDLKNIINNAKSIVWRRRAALRLMYKEKQSLGPEEERIVKEVAIRDRSNCVNFELRQLLETITNQTTLFEIVKNARNDLIKKQAFYNLKDQEYLKEIAHDVRLKRHLRCYAVEKIEDQVFLKDVSSNEKLNKDLRWCAIDRIEDQEYLKEIAGNEKLNMDLRWCAIDRIEDQEYLKEIAGNEKLNMDLRWCAIDRIEDQEFLKYIATNKELNEQLRFCAIERIHNQDYLNSIACDDGAMEKT